MNVMMPMTGVDNVLAPHILDWIYIKGFGEVKNPDKVLEAILNGVTMLESASKIDGTCNNNSR